MDGSVDFYRNFIAYENGFGNAEGELWLGMSNTTKFNYTITTVKYLRVKFCLKIKTNEIYMSR
jgi:hypothetical protein